MKFLKVCLITVFTFLALGSLSAQSFVGKLSPHPNKPQINSAQTDTVKILAVMVEFQKDEDNSTFGTGKFASIYTGENKTKTDILDPLPHDARYFRDHLEFVKNYFSDVSATSRYPNGKIHIEYEVLPDVLTLSKIMREYSPEIDSDDLTPLGNMSEEIWDLAAQQYPDFDFSEYELFTIFHAGVGRDVNLPGSIGIERDLPSVYLSSKSLRNIFGEDFDGFTVGSGNYKISNSMILPETENRELDVVGGKRLLQLSINGLIAASIASHLGAPDLFDTETGLSAIGRFGLMDGQGIFAYSGVFPPEPSPWTKMHLGWIEPEVVQPGNYNNLEVAARKAANSGESTLFKIPINAREYFLIENRIRDANNDGARITYKIGNETHTKTYDRDTTGFYSYDTDTLSGVVIDVDEFDWALPGNGIVIWHIDENVIANKLEQNAINTDKFNRGVDVEEADGVQDIGEQFQTIFGDEVVGEGAEEDFWFASNEAELYENKFGPGTRPATKSNDKANSLITFSEFSDTANTMEFNLSWNTDNITLITNYELPAQTGFPVVNYLVSEREQDNKLYLLYRNRELVQCNMDGSSNLYFKQFSFKNIAQIFIDNKDFLIGNNGSVLKIASIAVNGDTAKQYTQLPAEITSNLGVMKINDTQFQVILGTENGEIHRITVNTDLSQDIIKGKPYNEFNQEERVEQIIFRELDNGEVYLAAFSRNSYWIKDGSPQPFEHGFIKSALAVDANDNSIIVALLEENNFRIIEENGTTSKTFSVDSEQSIESFSLAPVKSKDINIVVPNAGNLNVYNLHGILIDNYPYEFNGENTFQTPVSFDLQNDGNAEILSVSGDGVMDLVDKTGNSASSFPLTVNSAASEVPKITNVANSNNQKYITLVTDNDKLFVWRIANTEGKIYWSGEYGNNANDGFMRSEIVETSDEQFFPEAKAYNWPNPVYEDETHIRYHVNENADVRVKIFDLGGELVAELQDKAVAGFDNETIWNVSNIESGVYFAHLELNSSTGKTASKIIKIAVVK